MKNQLQESTDRIANLEQIIDDLQGRLRRNTLIFKGIPEGTDRIPGTWSKADNFIATLLVNHLGMSSESLGIERVHRYPKNPKKNMDSRPRPTYVGFQSWKTANEILRRAKMSKENPFVQDGNEVTLFIEEMYSPNVSQECKAALRVRWSLKTANPKWIVYLKYPARIFYKTEGGHGRKWQVYNELHSDSASNHSSDQYY